jgi:tRNA-splicing ligase RtcB
MAPRMDELVEALYRAIPAGVGSKSPLDLDRKELNAVMRGGARWAVERGLGDPGDVTHSSRTARSAARVPTTSRRRPWSADAAARTLGSATTSSRSRWSTRSRPAPAEQFGLRAAQLTVMIHTGSRGSDIRSARTF